MLHKKKIGIIDYDQGNIQSVINSLDKINVDYALCKTISDLNNCTHIILPGVGSFPKVLSSLRSLNFIDALNFQVLKQGKFFLGICVGFQILFDYGLEQKKTEGLGWINGVCEKFNIKNNKIIIPHIGWNSVHDINKNPIFKNISDETDPLFYFIHSYKISNTDDQNVNISYTFYHEKFISSINKNNIYGVQFHPEKSQANGLLLLKNFVNLNA